MIDELLDLAVYAPNHHTTEPWRFIVVGPATIASSWPDDRRRQADEVAHGDRRDTGASIPTRTSRARTTPPAPARSRRDAGGRPREIASYWRTPKSLLSRRRAGSSGCRDSRARGRHRRTSAGRSIGFPAPPRRAPAPGRSAADVNSVTETTSSEEPAMEASTTADDRQRLHLQERPSHHRPVVGAGRAATCACAPSARAGCPSCRSASGAGRQGEDAEPAEGLQEGAKKK